MQTVNCLTTVGTILFFVFIFGAFIVGFFVGKKNGVKIVTTVMQQEHNISDTWGDIKDKYNKLKGRL